MKLKTNEDVPREIDIPDEAMQEIDEIVNDDYFLFDGLDDFFLTALRKELLNIRSLKLQKRKVELLEKQQE